MNLPKLNRINSWRTQFPLRFNSLILCALIIMAWVIKLETTPSNNTDDNSLFLSVGINIGLSILIALIAFSLCSVALAYTKAKSYFKQHGIADVKCEMVPSNEEQYQKIALTIPNNLIPFWGYLNGQVLLDKEDIFVVSSSKPINYKAYLFSPQNTQLKFKIRTPHYKNYKLSEFNLLFEDPLSLVRLKLSLELQATFEKVFKEYQHPINVQAQESYHLNEKSKLSLSKKDGDWFAQKSFEFGDDVRRIVWKQLAKRKELIVRKVDPEYSQVDTIKVWIDFRKPVIKYPEFPEIYDFLLDHFKKETYSYLKDLLEKKQFQLKVFFNENENSGNLKTLLNNQEWLENDAPSNEVMDSSLVITHSLLPKKVHQNLYSSINRKQEMLTIKLSEGLERLPVSAFWKRLIYLPSREFSNSKSLSSSQKRKLIKYIRSIEASQP